MGAEDRLTIAEDRRTIAEPGHITLPHIFIQSAPGVSAQVINSVAYI